MKTTIIALLLGLIFCGCSKTQATSNDSKGSFSIVGDWSGKAPDGTTIKYSFHKDGSVVWFVDESSFKQMAPSGLQAKYVIRKKSPLWEINIYDFAYGPLKGITFQGILQPINGRTFKMEGTPSNRGDRPMSFDKQAITFSKVSS